MTNSEAIQILQDTPIDVASTKRGILCLYAEALNMAIEALSCSEKPNESDLISRQAAIEAADDMVEPQESEDKECI